MYGLIHNSVRDLVLNDLGADVWEQVTEKAQVSEQEFLSLKSYEDAVLLRILGAISDVGGIPLDDLLYRFGLHFIRHTAYTHYAGVMSMYGRSLWDLLANLNHMHDRMTSSFPEYRPPTFDLTDLGNGQYELIYISERQGLTRFVEGLIDGMAKQFSTSLDVSVLEESVTVEGQQTRFLLVPAMAHD